jgi:hypothetical protein
VSHEVLISVTVDVRRLPGRRTNPADPLDSAARALVEELRLFSGRLENAGLTIDPPLSPAELAHASRIRSDPSTIGQLATLTRSLGAAAGVTPLDFGPMAVAERWDGARVDGAWHRTYLFASWPRLNVPAHWMDGALLGAPHITRTVTVVHEPIPPSRSARAVDRDLIRLETDQDDRARRGFRIRARDRRAVSEVHRREEELVSGHSEFEYVGLVTITASDRDTLFHEASEYEQQAAQAGIELRALDGRHAQGWVASLPIGRTLVPKVAR